MNVRDVGSQLGTSPAALNYRHQVSSLKCHSFRSRHCGDCRQCRLALDHHCPWFDADVMAPQTLLPFLLFLALIPPLLSIAFAPLLLPSYHSVRFMWKHANKSDYVNLVWWSRKRSWVGGPMYRWMIGFWLGEMRCIGYIIHIKV